jgi:hypothetical protein
VTDESRRWEEAVHALRERGYLGRRASSSGSGWRRLGPLGWLAAGAVLAVLSAIPVATAPPTAAAWALAVALVLPIVAVGLIAGVPVLLLAASRTHRAGFGVGNVAATAAVVAGVGLAAAWLGAVSRPPQLVSAGRLAWAVAAGLGAIFLTVRGVGRLVAGSLLHLRAADAGPAPRLRTVSAVTLAAAVLLAILTQVGGGQGRTVGGKGMLAVRPAWHPVAVIGVDGPTRDEVLLLAAQDVHLAGMRDWSWARIDLGGEGRSLPVRWITLATGVSPERHGVTTLRQVHVLGIGRDLLLSPGLHRLTMAVWGILGVAQERTVPAAYRRAPTVWEMAARAGAAVRVAGWWGSFPPRRVRGVVASERWLFTGNRNGDTVYPSDASDVPSGGGVSALAMDRRAVAMIGGANAAEEPLVMAYLPGWWLEESGSRQPPLLAAEALRPHLELLGDAVGTLLGDGYEVWLVALVPHGGGWVMSSAATGGERPQLRPPDLVATLLDALGLPPAREVGGSVRRDLSGVSGRQPLAVADYGGPPPLASQTTAAEGRAQLELLRNLGYLQ